MSNPTAPEVLKCSIVDAGPGLLSDHYTYVVTDRHGIVVASGVSSSPSWVKHDAGGYHTKKDFDAKFPHGWIVTFDF